MRGQTTGMKEVSAFLRASVRALRGTDDVIRTARLLLCSTACASSSRPC